MGLFLMTSSGAGTTLSEFTAFATEVLNWLITTFTTVLTWLVGHPIAMIGLVMSLIVMAIGTLRHLIGGSSKKNFSRKTKDKLAA